MANKHAAWLPDASVKIYDTCVFPSGKLSPGWWVLVTLGSIPELSVAVGSSQVTARDEIPNGTSYIMESGQIWMRGDSVSIANSVDIEGKYGHGLQNLATLCILCLTSRTTVTSARIPEENACHRACNLVFFSRVQKGTPRLTHKWCVLQRVFLDATSDVTVILGMRQSIVSTLPWFL